MNFDRIEHVAVVVEDLEIKAESLKKILGIKNVPTIDWTVKEDLDGNPIEPYTLRVAFFKMENIILELMQVIEGKSFYAQFGQGIHHLCFAVDDIKEEIKIFAEQGVQITETGKFAGLSFAFLGTKESCGFQLEMLQKRTHSRQRK